MKSKPSPLALLRTYALITLACAVYAAGFSWCYQPNDIAFGGVTGVAQIIHALFPRAPIGALVIALNIPLFLLGWRLIGGRLLVGSVYAMALSSVFLDLLDMFTPAPRLEPMLSAIFGGILLGAALGLIFLMGSTTGGTDLLARLLKLALPWLPMGRLVMAVDFLVIVLTAAVLRSLESALYGIVALYISSIVMDGVLYGLDNAKVAYIISDHAHEIAQDIICQLDRGVTVLRGAGAYSGAEKGILLCAFKRRQIVRLKALVTARDPAAFLIVCQAHEVLGDGFRGHGQDGL